eukprot:COSAG01_NODE_14617_length_1431_cov_1.616366_2_plen_86_part_00
MLLTDRSLPLPSLAKVSIFQDQNQSQSRDWGSPTFLFISSSVLTMKVSDRSLPLPSLEKLREALEGLQRVNISRAHAAHRCVKIS